ncbi:MAG: DUF1570 domain-containing protein [Pirellulaceae bacterium]|jgi:hypothetical protein|nr:DUF1570 domain-containing protein [Pirellulaceae bacterium]
MRLLLSLAFGVIALATPAAAVGDIVLYRLPGTKSVFKLQGKATTNPGRTVTFRHPLGTLHLALDDVKIFEQKSTRGVFNRKLQKAVRVKDVKACIDAARWALHAGMLKEFYSAASEAWKIDRENPTVKRLVAMKQKIDAPLASPEPQERKLREFTRDLRDMKFTRSRHFVLIHDTPDEKQGRGRKSRAEQRLELLETVYQSFLMKFCLEGVELDVPKEHLMVVLFSEQADYLRFVNLIGPQLKSTSGFYHRIENISVFFDQGTDDTFKVLYEMNRELQAAKAKAIKARAAGTRDLVRFADTLHLLTQLSHKNSDIEVVSHEATHHMAGNTGLMPPTSPIPVWAAEGLATYFESPKEAAWSGIGAVNTQRLNWYRELEPNKRFSNIDFIVSDNIFTLSASHEATLHGWRRRNADSAEKGNRRL